MCPQTSHCTISLHNINIISFWEGHTNTRNRHNIMEEKEPLSLISLNTNGLGEIKKRTSMIGWLKNTQNAKNKIIFLQETHTTAITAKRWKGEWKDWEMYFSHGDSNSKGAAIFIPKSMEHEIIEIIECEKGKYTCMYINVVC